MTLRWSLLVPSSRSNSMLSQSLIQVTFCTEFVWFRANSVILSELSSDSEEYKILPLNFALIQRSSEITSQLVLKTIWISTIKLEISLKLILISTDCHWTLGTGHWSLWSLVCYTKYNIAYIVKFCVSVPFFSPCNLIYQVLVLRTGKKDVEDSLPDRHSFVCIGIQASSSLTAVFNEH